MDNNKHRYDDIIDLPHHQSATRKRMSMIERAAQFNAFRALTGYGDAVRETARLTEKRMELDEYAKAEINAKLIYMQEHMDEGKEFTVTYFVPDDRKDGGAYVVVTDIVKKIQKFERIIVMENGVEIPIEEIYSIESEAFRFMDYNGE